MSLRVYSIVRGTDLDTGTVLQHGITMREVHTVTLRADRGALKLLCGTTECLIAQVLPHLILEG